MVPGTASEPFTNPASLHMADQGRAHVRLENIARFQEPRRGPVVGCGLGGKGRALSRARRLERIFRGARRRESGGHIRGLVLEQSDACFMRRAAKDHFLGASQEVVQLIW